MFKTCLLMAGFLMAFAGSLSPGHAADGVRKLVIVAGKPSHPPRMHEFNAGVQLLEKCLRDVPGLDVHVVLNGWPSNENIFDDASAVVFYMDGGGRHEVVQEQGRRLKMVNEWADRGVGLGFMHYAVEIVPAQAGREFQHWIGGHYEHMFSCNPIWEPHFVQFPKHPITRGVRPFRIKDEWYFNMRFTEGLVGNESQEVKGMKYVPILVAAPSENVRNGPYVYPKGPYPHIQEAKGRPEAMMWAVERANGGRGYGFTGGHFHDNWKQDEFRRVILNAMVWLTGSEIPAGGIDSVVTLQDLDANLDPKSKRR